jgi:hypothetical protein
MSAERGAPQRPEVTAGHALAARVWFNAHPRRRYRQRRNDTDIAEKSRRDRFYKTALYAVDRLPGRRSAA